MLETSRQWVHLIIMTKHKPPADAQFEKPAYWTNDPPPKPKKGETTEELSPTRYGDWVKDGIAIDF